MNESQFKTEVRTLFNGLDKEPTNNKNEDLIEFGERLLQQISDRMKARGDKPKLLKDLLKNVTPMSHEDYLISKENGWK